MAIPSGSCQLPLTGILHTVVITSPKGVVIPQRAVVAFGNRRSRTKGITTSTIVSS